MVRQDENGYYGILSACTGKALDARGGQPIPGKEVLLWTDHAGANQRWAFEDVDEYAPLGEGNYVISPKTEQDFAIDIRGGIVEDMTSGEAIIYTKKEDNNDNQQFRITHDEDSEYYTIQNPASGLYMSAESDSSNRQKLVFSSQEKGSCKQQWRITRSSLGFYTVQSACVSAVLDVSGGSIQNSKDIILYPSHGGANQQWVFIKQ